MAKRYFEGNGYSASFGNSFLKLQLLGTIMMMPKGISNSFTKERASGDY
jgi:hypothetical protein